VARRQSGGRLRAAVFLTVSLVAAAVATSVILSVIQGYQQEIATAQAPEETIQVIIAAGDLHQGRTITAEDLKMRALPPDYVPDSVLRQPDQVIGRVPRERILKGEFIRDERLADPEAGVGLNAIIPRGMRAVSVSLRGANAVSGFLNPGNYVDVLATVQAQVDREVETITLLQAVTVLAVNDRLGGGAATANDKAKPSVTLAVTPEQAERLTHADEMGNITLALRNDIDVTQVTTHGLLVAELLGGRGGEKRHTVQQWKERIVQQQDGTLIIIKGPSVTMEKADAKAGKK
jgi:pilus assembly protein CpaB